MADMTLAVKITGDASSLSKAVDSANSKIKSLHSSINDKGGTAGLAEIGSQVQKIGDKFTKLGKAYTVGVTAPIVAGSTSAVKKFAEVDKTMQLTNATMGNSEAEARKLDKAMKDAASSSVFGMDDAAGATLNFARAGLDASEAAAALAPAMNLAAGEGGNLDTVSAGLVATINGFGGTFDETSKYADVFANACNNSALDIDSLSSAMSVAAPIFSAAGYEVNDAALYMGVMANAGIEANTAANSLKTGMARLVAPSKQGAEWMDKLGISITNADGTMKDSVQVQKELHDAFSGLSDSEKVAAASAIFGKNQMSNWLALIETAPEDVSQLSKELEKEGTTAEMAEAMMSGFGGSLEKLKSSIDVAATSFGEALAPAISKVADKVQSVVDWFNQLDPAQQQQIANIALVVAAIGPLLIVIGKITSGVGGVISAMGSLGTTFGTTGISAGTLIGSFGQIAGVAALVIGALVGMYQNSESFRTAVDNLVQTALTTLVAIFEALKPVIDQVLEALKPVMAALGDALAPIIDAVALSFKLLTPFIVMVIKALGEVVQAITPVIEWIAKLISKIMGPLTEAFKAIMGTIEKVIGWFGKLGKQTEETSERQQRASKDARQKSIEDWEAMKTKCSEAWENMKSTISSAWESIKSTSSQTGENLKSGWNDLKTSAGHTWENIKDAVTRPMETAQDHLSRTWDTITTAASSASDSIQSGWNSLHGTASMIWSGIGRAITYPIEYAKHSIVSAWGNVIDILTYPISLPHIELPHFSIYGSFSLDPPSVPDIDVSWYAKGGVFSRASVIGVGEAGPEAVAPIDKLKAYVAEAVTNARSATMDYTAIDSLADAITSGFAMQNTPTQGGEYRFIVELGGTRVAEKIYTLNREGEIIMKGV